MGLIQTLKSAIAKWASDNDTSLTGRGSVSADFNIAWARYFQLSGERTAVHKDMHRMDRNDEIISFALNTIASRALGMEDPTLDAFTVIVQSEKVPGMPEYSAEDIANMQYEIHRLDKRLKLQGESWQTLRRTVKWGNEFWEVIPDPVTLDIVGIKLLPEHTMWPNTDERGSRVPGFTQKITTGEVRDIKFKDWEIIHFAFGEIDGYLGTPLLVCARKNWKRLNLAEDSTAVARLIRAFMKLIHRVPVGVADSKEQQKAAITAYKEQMSKRKVFDQDTDALDMTDWPQTVSTDMYIPDDGTKRGGVEMLDPENAQLQNIRDIEHFVDRIITATHIPKRYFPFEGSTPKLSEGGGNAEDKNFACLLVICQNVLKQGLSELFDRQLLLKGYDPSRVRYVFKMADINTVDQFRVSQTQMNRAKTFDLLMNQVPGLREHVNVWVREYLRLDDASAAELMNDPNLSKSPPTLPAPATTVRARVTEPGMGAGSDGRTQV